VQHLTGDAMQLYWSETVGPIENIIVRGSPSMIFSMAKAGGPVMPVGGPIIGAFVVEGSNVYATQAATSVGPYEVIRIPLTGSTRTPVVLGEGAANPAMMMTDATHVYSCQAGSVSRTPKAGGTTVPVVSLIGMSCGSMALDATNVYFSVASVQGIVKIQKVAKTGGEVITLVSDHPAGLLYLDAAGKLVFSGSGFIAEMDTQGGTPNARFWATMGVRALVGHGSTTFWIANEVPLGSFNTTIGYQVVQKGDTPSAVTLATTSHAIPWPFSPKRATASLYVDDTQVYWVSESLVRDSNQALTGIGGGTIFRMNW
jgi:hypothetical protein